MSEGYTPHYVGNVPARLFIGLGGVGGRAVQRIYQRLYKNQTWKTYKAPCTGFLVLDTNEGDLAQYTREDGIRAIHMARSDSHEMLAQRIRDKDHYLAHFMDPGYRPRKSQKGAGQIRIESRVKFYLRSEDIARTIEETLDRILSTNNVNLKHNKCIDVFVFCSLAGGTGSGCFLPMAYLIRNVIESKGFRPTLFGNFMTSEALECVVKPEIYKYIHANTYAGLKELEHMSRLGCVGVSPMPFVYRRPKSPTAPIPKVEDAPYNWVVLVDEPSGRDLDNASDKLLADAMADTAYINLMTPAHVMVEGEKDNYTRFMTTMSHLASTDGGRLDEHAGFTKYYGTHGSAALICPDESLLQYCVRRFVADTLKNQLGAVSDDDDALYDRKRFPDLDPEKLNEAINKKWIRWVEDQKDAESVKAKKQLEDIAEVLGDIEMDQGGGYFERVIDRVRGKKEAEDSAAGGGLGGLDLLAVDDSDSVQALEDKTLVDQLAGLLETAIDEQSFKRLTSGQLGSGEMQTVSAVFDAKVAQAQGLKSAIEKLKRRLCTQVMTGQRFVNLREDNVQEPIDATTERFLILTLLTERKIDAWIQDAREDEEATRPASLFDERKVEAQRSAFREYQSAATAPSRAGWWERVWGNPAGEAGEAGDEANAALSGLCAKTNQNVVAQLRLAQLEALKSYLENRAKTYSLVSRVAMNRVLEQERKASEMLEASNEGEHNYAIHMEVLTRLDIGRGTRGRLWDAFWNDYASEELAGHLADPGWSSDLINQAFTEEEERASLEKTEPDTRRIIAHLIEGFREVGETQLRVFIQGDGSDEEPGLTLDSMLELEALYATMKKLGPKETRRSRIKKERQILQAKGDDGDPDYDEVYGRVEDYVQRKMAALANKAVLLSKINAAKVADRADMSALFSQVLIGDRGVLDRLGDRYPNLERALRAPDGDNRPIDVANQTGFQSWDNPRVMMIYSVAGVLPLFAFERIQDLHQHYASLAYMGSRKVNPLHTDFNWETSLPDLDPESVEYERSWNRLRDCLATGTVYKHQGMWRLRLGEDSKGGRAELCPDISTLHESFVAAVQTGAMGAEVDAVNEELGLDHQRRMKLAKKFEAILKEEKLAGRPGSAMAEAASRLISELNELMCP